MSLLTIASQYLQRAKTAIAPVVANVERILNPITEFTRANPLTTGATLGTIAGTAGTLGVTKIVSSVRNRRKKKSTSRKTKSKRKTKRSKRKKSRYHRKRRNYKYARTAGKGKDRSTRRIRMTKNGQPYVILRSGKARFISKASARRSRKLKGGRY